MSVTKPPSPKQLKNEAILTIYALFLCGLFFCVVLARWRHSPDVVRRARLFVSDKFKKSAVGEWLGRPSVGLVALVGIFLAANIALCSTSFASHAVNHFASRYGWMGAANMALCVFLGMKNTPISLISAVSHAEINILHRIVGYAAALLILLHAVLYTVHLGRQGRWTKLLEGSDMAGIGAGISMLILALTGLFRHRGYEMFYVGHMAGFLAVVVLAILHRPDWAKKLPIVMLFTACIWALDRIIRTARLSWNSVNNQATCYPLPGGGTRLLLKKPSFEGAPGSHCYLWLPRVHLFQMHPFTIVSNGPSGLELVIKSHQGFTKTLNDFAIKRPSHATWVSLDGPYGSLPDTTIYDKLVFIAGGSGAAFTFGMINRILHSSERVAPQSIDFVWAVKRTEHLGWFGEHLQTLTKVAPSVNVVLHITSEESGFGEDREMAFLPEVSKPEDETEIGETEPLLRRISNGDVEHTPRASVLYEKLNAEAVVRDAMLGLGSGHRILVAACGPKSLMDTVRDSVDGFQREMDYRIDVHCEDFGGS